MPRTTVLESPGCPPLRALTTDILGLVKVVEARTNPAGAAKVVETWGEPDASRAIVAASLADRAADPVLAMARKNGVVELLNPLNGDALAAVKTVGPASDDGSAEGDPLVVLHLFTRQASDSMLGTFIACTDKGKASIRSIMKENAASGSDAGPSTTWDVCSGGNVQFCSVDHGESYAMFGGKGIEVNLWDIASCSKTWSAKSPRANSLGIFTRPWFTAGTFLCKDDHRKIVACTNNHQVRLYDTSLQRRPAISVDFREAPIKAVAADPNGHNVYIGTGTGDLASFDMRTGKLLGCYIGKCSGSIRSIVRHPELPLIASCGLDSYLRIWDTNTRQLLSAIFLKQHLTTVVIDSHFSVEGYYLFSTVVTAP
jgi:ribosome biogenesis protein NSA1